MKMNLKNYMEERDHALHTPDPPGPVITVSRSYGCEEQEFVKMLIRKLNHLRENGLKSHAWKSVKKEVIEQSAKTLKMQSYDVENRVMVHHEPQSEWLAVFDAHQKWPDSKILETIKEQMLAYAEKGNVILIGKGGVGVLKSLENSLHIRLTAPFDYRVSRIARKMNMNSSLAEDMVRSIDQQRKKWAEHLVEESIHDSDFDLVFNMERMSADEMADMVVNLLRKRGLVSA